MLRQRTGSAAVGWAPGRQNRVARWWVMAASFESSKHQWPLSIPFPTAGGRAIPPRPLVWLMRLLCCAALGVTGYLAVTALQEGEVAGCGSGGTFDCSYVLHSRWSKVLGVPVSIPAFAL